MSLPLHVGYGRDVGGRVGQEEVAEETIVGEGKCGGQEREEGGFFCKVVGGVSLRTVLGTNRVGVEAWSGTG
jgi:hypothetical protein